MIVLVHGAPAFGAVERYVVEIVEGLRARGEEVTLLHPDAPELTPFAELAGGNIRVQTFSVDAPAPLITLRLARTLRALHPRVVHVTDVWPPGMLAARLARAPRTLVTHHTPEFPRQDNLIGRLMLAAAWRTRPETIYTSESDMRADGRTLRSHVVALGIDLARFDRPRNPAGVIGTIGRLAPQKDQRRIIEAAPIVLERYPQFRFEIAGEGELREELEAAIRAAGLDDTIRLLGARSDVPELLAQFDVFAMPSLYEGLCVAVLEAQAAGVPVVATPVGGMIETVVPGETGTRIEPGDARSLAEGILWVLDNRRESEALAAEAKKRAHDRFSAARMVDATIALYD